MNALQLLYCSWYCNVNWLSVDSGKCQTSFPQLPLYFINMYVRNYTYLSLSSLFIAIIANQDLYNMPSLSSSIPYPYILHPTFNTRNKTYPLTYSPTYPLTYIHTYLHTSRPTLALPLSFNRYAPLISSQSANAANSRCRISIPYSYEYHRLIIVFQSAVMEGVMKDEWWVDCIWVYLTIQDNIK